MALAAVWAASARPTQDEPPQPGSRPSEELRPGEPRRGGRRAGEAGPPEHHGRAGGPADTGFRPRWGRSILDPAEEDRGPLRPGEEAELRQFVDEKVPRLARLLRRIDEQSPGAVHQGFARLAPRLRQLRRIQAENPKLAESVEQHAANLFRVENLRRAWLRADPDRRPPIEQEMRTCLAENLSLEIEVLGRWADDLQSSREERIAARLATLTKDDADLAAEPEEIRAVVEQLGAAGDEAQRQALWDRLTALLGTELDRQIVAIQRRAEVLRLRAPQEVDRRLAHLLEAPPPREPKP
jgi:hypothetical protein